jgi:superfamily II DNA or RNA helicase
MIVIDEAHHAVAASYRACVEHFASAVVVGFTATPDRGDEVALRHIFESVAYEYAISDAIGDGWLVPVTCSIVDAGIDWRALKISHGDFSADSLSTELMRAGQVERVAGPIVELADQRRTIAFTPTVAVAYALRDALRERGVTADACDGSSDDVTRDRALARFRSGESRVLINCALWTEGFDAPHCDCVAIVRPTKSRALFAQMIGRGTRPIADLSGDTAARKASIASSVKPNMLVLDFAANADRLSLANVADVLAGKEIDGVAKLADEILAAGDTSDVQQAIEFARAKIDAATKRKLRDEAKRAGYSRRNVDPFASLGISHERDRWGRSATENQLAAAEKILGKDFALTELDHDSASRLIGEAKRRRDQGLASYRQCRVLQRAGIDPSVVWRLPFQRAGELMGQLVAAGWKAPREWKDLTA